MTYENNTLEVLRQGQIEGLVVGTMLTVGIMICSKSVREAVNRLGLTIRRDQED